ncbi:MAG: leucine-rich repeat domain-containing protein [Eubacteriales bacterium]|nr:leucine-rich repeat domain-containing protein [Eubacteriales bacterium]
MERIFKNHRQHILPIFFLAVLFFIHPVKANAFSVHDRCGTDVYYSYTSDNGVLRISGNGPMNDYSYNYETESYGRPWENWDIKTLIIEQGVTHIGSDAFGDDHCRFTNVVLPSSCISIGENAFSSCEQLTDITLPEGLKTIGNYAFASSGLKSVTLPSTLTSYGDCIFSYCPSISTVTINCNRVPESAFEHCGLINKVTFSSKCTSIDHYAFYGCDFPGNAITIPSTVKSIAQAGIGYGPAGEDCSETKGTLVIIGATGSGAFNYAKKYGFEFRISGYTAPKIKKAVNVKTRRIKLTWNRKTKTTGYQIAYSLSSGFKSGNKYITITKYKTTTKTTAKLKKNKTYYIRIRAYRTVSGKKCYSTWSSAKKVKIKK